MNRKWTLFTFSRGDFKTVEHYLNRQAEQGWELEKTGILARWKRTDRRDLAYCVDLAKPKQRREERQEYAELCGESGWELTALTGGMYIFKSRAGAELIPIHTDPELERKQYNRYYIWNTILCVLVLALYFAFMVGIGAALGGGFEGYVGSLRYHSLRSWTFLVLPSAMLLWGIWAVWRLADFVRAILAGREGRIGNSPRWVMWINGILAFVAGVGAVIFFAGYILQTLLGQSFESYLYIWCLMWAGIWLYRALGIEKELFRHERRRHIVGGVACLICFVLLVVGRVAFRPGDWSVSAYSGDREKGMLAYTQTYALPLVHGEDVGVPFLPEDESVSIYHEEIPAGEKWSLRYLYGSKKTSHGVLGAESTTYACRTEGLAVRLTTALVNGYKLDRYTSWPQGGLTSIDIDWADEAWYGTVVPKDGAVITALVLRVGEQVTRMVYPADLISEENLEIIRAELMK